MSEKPAPPRKPQARLRQLQDRLRPLGRLPKKLVSRRAPWWLRIARSLTLAAAAMIGIDQLALPNLPGRALTPGETAMLREVFRDSVDYDRVRVHHSAAADLYLRVLNSDGATHRNLIILPRNKDSADYARAADDYLQYAFLHEGAHVWQGQNGVMPGPVAMAFNNYTRWIPGHDHLDQYYYDLRDGRDLTAYNIEQQASIIADFHHALAKGEAPVMNVNQPPNPKAAQAAYARVLANFHRDPAYPRQK